MQAAPGTPLTAAAAPARSRRVAVLVGVAVFVLAADIVSKALVVAHLQPEQPVHVLGNVLMLWLTRNPGAAFSVGTGETIVFTLIAFGVVVYIARTARKLDSLGWAIALGLLLGGAMGNLGDRIFRAPGLFRGDVVDWIAVTRYYPIFNLADSAIVCGGILTVLLAMRGHRLDGSRGDGPAPDGPAQSAGADSGSAESAGADSGSADSAGADPAGADSARADSRRPGTEPAGPAEAAESAES